jgi:hypothetical protein
VYNTRWINSKGKLQILPCVENFIKSVTRTLKDFLTLRTPLAGKDLSGLDWLTSVKDEIHGKG